MVNIGHNDAHNTICHRILCDSLGQEIDFILKKDLQCSRNSGKRLIIPNTIKIIPEKIFHICGSIVIKTVETFNKKVKSMIDNINDVIIVIILL